ncbi:hypothetical protein LTR01_002130 [Friedmanniomyces endolithicus]|nr:hypothetical protein LTS09_008441 [Friedmanniomyces endolithicus]KAK0313873.1 hypothetical protein LTR01_002130 [Friedmanniomyces endolithicus]KAK0831446.1 hypothetical protein LTR73_002828 [Friedmanniomyces endolithicus]
MPMATSSRGPPSADTLSRRPSKRSYVDMDNDDSDTSEKGKKRASVVTNEGSWPTNVAPRSDLTDPTGGHSSSADRRRNVPGSFRGRAETALHAVLNRKGGSDRVVAKDAPPETGPKRQVATTKVRLDAALAEIVLLRDQLAVADETGQQNVLKARQDEVFHVEVVTTRLELLEERYRKVVSQLNSAQRRAVESDLAKTTHEAHVKALDAHVLVLDQRVRKLMRERDAYAGEAEHYQALLTTAEEETQELRRIETEDRAQRARDAEKRTLPPAYGSLLDDEPVAATKELIDSGGHFEVANFKHMIRSTFMVALTSAQATLEATNALPGRTAVLQSRTDARFVLVLVSALAKASRNIDDVLVRAGDFWACSVYHSDLKSMSYQVRREAARHVYVADRFAKTLTDLVLRTLAALELRPLKPSLLPSEASTVALGWSTVDECLLKALRSLFNEGRNLSKGASSRLFELQYYVTHVSVLQGRLQLWRATSAQHDGAASVDRRKYFKSTDDWLQERVESERMQVAGYNEESDEDADVDGDANVDDSDAGSLDAASPAPSERTVPANRSFSPVGAVTVSFTPAATNYAAAQPLVAVQPDITVPLLSAPGVDRVIADGNFLAAQRQRLSQIRTDVTQYRMGMYRRSSLYSANGRSPNTSQGSATASPPAPMLSRGTNSDAPQIEPITVPRRTAGETPSRRRRSASVVSMSSEDTAWPSDPDSDDDDQA